MSRSSGSSRMQTIKIGAHHKKSDENKRALIILQLFLFIKFFFLLINNYFIAVNFIVCTGSFVSLKVVLHIRASPKIEKKNTQRRKKQIRLIKYHFFMINFLINLLKSTCSRLSVLFLYLFLLCTWIEYVRNVMHEVCMCSNVFVVQ